MYKKIILDNGIPLVMESIKGTRSVCIGIWVRVGSRNEKTDQNGISHFLEHVFFKGTGKRSANDIAIEIDSLGGELNAFTSRESTTFYIKVLDEHMGQALDLITDIFLNPVFPEDEIEKEKGVVFDEINLIEDTPEDYIHDMFNRNIWGDSGLGQSVIGKKEVINTFSRNDILTYVKNNYGSESIILSCSGNFREKRLIGHLNRTIGTLKRESKQRKGRRPAFRSGTQIIPKKLSEVHICLGIQGLHQNSEDRYAMQLLNTVLGAGVSSRLFLEIREKRGLAYSIGSFNVSYRDTGVWTVYSGTSRNHVSEVINIITDQMNGLPASLTEEELAKAKNQFKGNIVLALESTSSRMINMAKQEIYFGEYYSPEEIIRAVESVSFEEVKSLSERLLKKRSFALAVYGPVKEKDIQKGGLGGLK
jgi:predicted Zn-dependent peptidase